MGRITHLVGIDEAGRGPIAGPVAVGGVVFSVDDYKKYCKSRHRLPHGIDSKKLKEEEREEYYEWLQKIPRHYVTHTASLVSADIIDRKGIAWAIRHAVARVLARFDLNPLQTNVLLDGGLCAPQKFVHQETMIRGDEKEAIIGLASIVAKVYRDRYMKRQAKRFPEYSFERHKGYGTAQHYTMISTHGLCVLHRKTFVHR